MKRPTIRLLSLYLLSAPLLAQTQIGGGTCSSASLNGIYAMTLTGRQLSSGATFVNVLQGNGAATFDGQSKVTMQLTADTLKNVASPLPLSGTYTVQANCAGTVSITTGGAITFNLAIYNQGNAFLVTGLDGTYAYTGGGNTQPASGCAIGKLSGVYTINATGYGVSGGAVTGIDNAVGLAQFDGIGAVTVNASLSSAGANPSTLTLTGKYSLSSNCLGSATLSDSLGNSYVMNLSVSGASNVAVTAVDVLLNQTSKFIISGAAHPIYGQPTASAIDNTLAGERQ